MARQITLELLADSGKFESGMKEAARAAEVNAEKIEDAAKKTDRMSGALDRAGEAADNSESKFMGLSDVASGLGDLFGIEALGPIAATGLALGDLTGGFAQLAPTMTGAIDKIKNLSVVTKAQTVVQGALNAVMALNPIALVVIAVVALVAALVLAYQKSETFRDIVQGAFQVVKTAVGDALGFMLDRISDVIGALATVADKIPGLGGVADGLRAAQDKIDGMSNSVKRLGDESTNAAGHMRGLEDRMNALRAQPNVVLGVSMGPNLGAADPRLGRLPERRAAGGPVAAGAPYFVGEAGPELFIPRASGTIVPNSGASTTIVLQLDGRVLTKAVVDGLNREQRSSGVMTKLVA